MATTTPAPTTAPANVYGAIPGLNNLIGQGTSNITNLLSGTPSPSYARTIGAYAGATAGQPGQASQLGTFGGNLGLDLYHNQAQQNQQTGLADLTNLIQAASGNLAPTGAQNQQNQLQYAQLGQQGQEFNSQLALQSFMDQINSVIGLSNAGGAGAGAISNPNQSFIT
jgi:hypothetical protein